MKSKKFIFLFVATIIIITASIYLFDSFGSKIVNEKALELDLPDFITHGDISLSTIGSNVLIKDVLIKMDNEHQTVYCDEIILGTSYKEIFTLIKNKELKELGAFNLELKNIIINFDNIIKHKIASNILIDFDGFLTKEMLENIDHEFPNTDQTLSVKISNFNIPSTQSSYLQKLIPNLQPDILTDCKFTLSFLPKSKQISLKEFVLKNQYIKSIVNLKLDYNGDKPDNMVPIKFDFEGESDFDFDDLLFGDNDMSVSLGKGGLNCAFFIDGNLDDMDESDIIKNVKGEINFAIKNFKVNASNKIIKNIPGLKLKNNEIRLRNFRNELKWDGDNLVNNLDISSSLINLSSNIDVKLEFNRRGDPDIRKSSINKCMLRIGVLNEDLDNLVQNFEKSMLNGKLLPREGEDIVLNVTGTFAKPNIEGLDLY